MSKTIRESDLRVDDPVSELSAEELDRVSGGMHTTFTYGNNTWDIGADANGYHVDHTHTGPV
jgi:hypothetical protein